MRETIVTAGIGVGWHVLSMRPALSIASAHSTPASAASKACVERYWLAEVFCSKIMLRLE